MATNIPLTGEFRVTCEYKRKGNWSAGWHTGIDLVGPEKIYSSCDGEVIRTGYDKSYGNYIVVRNKEDGRYHWFCHLSQISNGAGKKVSRTTVIGIMGSTGNSTGKHLHFEIRNASNKYADTINPADYMRIPNKVGTYNSANYQISETVNTTNKTKVFAVKTNIRETPSLKGVAHLYKANTTVEILQENVANADGYIWDKVKAIATGRVGYVARTNSRYK